MASRGTFFGIEIGRTGLSTAQFGLDVTGHNIANTDTDGYTRQRIVQTAYDPFSSIGRFAPLPGHQLVGGGTRVMILNQIRSEYLDRRFRTENQTHEYWSTRTERLSYMESFFDNVNEETSINHSLAEFFRSMEVLAQDPVSGAPRTLMQTTAMDLVQQLNMIYKGLMDLQESEDRVVKTKVSDINQIVQDMVELNKAIYDFEITGLIANDLRDKRNLLVDQLSSYIDITYEEYPDPDNPKFDHFRVMIDGVKIVDHVDFKTLGVVNDPVEFPNCNNSIPGEPPVNEIRWILRYKDGEPMYGNAIDFNNITGGQLKAHLDVRDGTGVKDGVMSTDSRTRGIPYYVEMVNDLARALVLEVNNVHMQGWTDHPLGSTTGVLFFHEEPQWSMWTDYDPFEPRADGDKAYRHIAGSEPPRWAEYEWFSTAGADGTGDFLMVAGGNYIQQDPATGEYLIYDSADEPVGPAFDPLNGLERVLDPEMMQYISAKDIMLSEAIVESAFNIACSSQFIDRAASGGPDETQRHNNENIRKLYELFSDTTLVVNRLIDDGTGTGGTTLRMFNIGTFDDYGTVIRFDLGKTLQTAKTTKETCRLLTLAAENQRTAISGVSLDEEMVGMVKYQHAYNGASRVITAVDEALDRLINGTGRVGL